MWHCSSTLMGNATLLQRIRGYAAIAAVAAIDNASGHGAARAELVLFVGEHRRDPVALQQPGDVRRRLRRGEEEALREVAAEPPQRVQLLEGLDPFRERRQSQR